MPTTVVTTSTDYLSRLCGLDFVKAFTAACVSIITLFFGEDHTAIILATVLFTVDTTMGVMYAWLTGTMNSKDFSRAITKLFVMVQVFVALAVLTALQPELRYLLHYIPAVFCIVEAYSVIENAHKLYPNPITAFLLRVFGDAKSNALKQLNTKAPEVQGGQFKDNIK